MPKKYTPEETLKIGKEACEYARLQILKGGTQLENNDLSREDFLSHHFAVTKVRTASQNNLDSSNILLPESLTSYMNRISFTSKYSVGNCHELALQALDYLLKYQPDCEGELYAIFGGDHGFLVLNRDPTSNPADPETWGDSAVICDPWANKVFAAKEYRSKLKNFYFDEILKNRLEDFNPSKHSLGLHKDDSDMIISTRSIREMREDQKTLKEKFVELSAKLIQNLINYKDILEKERNRLQKQYGDNNFKFLIINVKIGDIEKLLKEIATKNSTLINSNRFQSAEVAKEELEKMLREMFSSVKSHVEFNEIEKKELFQLKGTDSKTAAMKIFGIHSKTQSNLESNLNAMSNLASQLDSFLRKKH